MIIFYNHFPNYFNVERLFIGLLAKEWRKLVCFVNYFEEIFDLLFKELIDAENRVKDLIKDYKQYENRTIENDELI